MFEGRSLLIATKHGKEKVIAPILEKELGVKCFVTSDFDTDELGTFTGEVERKDDPITTARKKCSIAMELANCDLALASEGSFGPHPTLFFIAADDEFLLLTDKKNDLEILAREITTETNFNGSDITTERELNEFAKNAGFPSHALILRKTKDEFADVVKGITNPDQLNSEFSAIIANYGSAFIETDMRAMFNPTRMKVIEKAAAKLVDKIKSLCPECGTPGYSVTDKRAGLPCQHCSLPTRSTLSFIYSCKKCSYSNEEKYPNGKRTEEPTYCDFCNP